MSKLSVKDLISIKHLTENDLYSIINLTFKIKKLRKKGKKFQPLVGKTLGMIFQKSSTRTRVSFEVGIYELGGSGLFLNASDLQLGRGETIKDTASVLSRYINGIMIRTYNHNEVIELAEQSSIPVINGLTDLVHPCQVLGDIFTLFEKKGKPVQKLKIAFIGDANNVANSWLYATSKLGLNFNIASPENFQVKSDILSETKKNLKSGSINVTTDPGKVAADADVIYTDVWASMGQEQEYEKRKKVFANYQVNSKLLKLARSDVMVMHCLPAHRGEEITDEVMDGANSVIFDQAENRLHVQKAIMTLLMS